MIVLNVSPPFTPFSRVFSLALKLTCMFSRFHPSVFFAAVPGRLNRFNRKTRNVELKSSKHTQDASALQKTADFIQAFMLGFEVQVVLLAGGGIREGRGGKDERIDARLTWSNNRRRKCVKFEHEVFGGLGS